MLARAVWWLWGAALAAGEAGGAKGALHTETYSPTRGYSNTTSLSDATTALSALDRYIYDALLPEKIKRVSLIGTFDISKIFQKKKFRSPKKDSDRQPSASPLRASDSATLVTADGATQPTRMTTGIVNSTREAELNTTKIIAADATPSKSSVTTVPTTPAMRPVTIPSTRLVTTPTTRPVTTSTTRSETTPATRPITTPFTRLVTTPATRPVTTSTTRTETMSKTQETTPVRGLISKNNSTKSSGGKKSRKSKAAVPGAAAGGSGGRKKGAEGEVAWPVKHAAVVDGDIILGGLMMVHGRSERATCGPLMAQGGLHALEAMLFALDEARSVLAPAGVRLGGYVLDDCDNDTYGLEMALDFIKGSIGNIEDGEYAACSAAGPGGAGGVGGAGRVISGVVGAASSVTSVQVANLLRLFKIPQVSYFSTSPELSNKARFEYFSRTIPSDQHQARAIVAIVRRLRWRYVSVVYEESNYGIKAFEELETLLARGGVCIAVKERLVKDSGELGAAAYDRLVQRLLSRPRARGVIVFASDQEVRGVMAAVGRAGAAGALAWLGSDGWAARALVADGNERAVAGTVSVQPRARPLPAFRRYFTSLHPSNNSRNPWFVEFWEQQFQCRWPGAPRTPYNGHFARACSGRERLPSTLRLEAQLQFVADAVLAFAHAIKDMHAALCGRERGVCAAMRPVSGATLLRYLRQVRFKGLSGEEFHFDANGDGPARYTILHYRRDPAPPAASASGPRYVWLPVGEYTDGELRLDMDKLQWGDGAGEGEAGVPASVCSAECGAGQAKQYVEGERCCWHCFNCSRYEIRPADSEGCVACALGWAPDAARAACRPLPALYLRPDQPAARAAAALAAAGALLTLFAMAVWWRRWGTPVVRASGAELSLAALGGLLLCYLAAASLLLKPSHAVCALQRFATGLCFTLVYSALLTKTARIARIFAASRRSARAPPLISPRSQLAICAALVSVQVGVLGVWQAARPARAVWLHPSRGARLLACDTFVDASCGVALAYPAALVAVCTLYAVLTRKIPEAFNESKHIGFTMYTTCVLWLAAVPLYVGTASSPPLRVVSVAVTISLSASVTLVCLFAPKMYIILIRPSRNVRGPLTAARWRSGAAGGVAGGVAGGARAALACAAPLDPTPSTDRSTLPDLALEKTQLTDKEVQTEESTLVKQEAKHIARDVANGGVRAPVSLPLAAGRLACTRAGLPRFPPAGPPDAPPPL